MLDTIPMVAGSTRPRWSTTNSTTTRPDTFAVRGESGYAARLGMAVAIEDGLITPVIRDAQNKRLAQIGREAKELAGRARTRKLKPDEFTGSTFSVSNLGMFGIDQFTAIINPPEAGILAVGAGEGEAVLQRSRGDPEIVVRDHSFT